jgi:hypothetical protein
MFFLSFPTLQMYFWVELGRLGLRQILANLQNFSIALIKLKFIAIQHKILISFSGTSRKDCKNNKMNGLSWSIFVVLLAVAAAAPSQRVKRADELSLDPVNIVSRIKHFHTTSSVFLRFSNESSKKIIIQKLNVSWKLLCKVWSRRWVTKQKKTVFFRGAEEKKNNNENKRWD